MANLLCTNISTLLIATEFSGRTLSTRKCGMQVILYATETQNKSMIYPGINLQVGALQQGSSHCAARITFCIGMISYRQSAHKFMSLPWSVVPQSHSSLTLALLSTQPFPQTGGTPKPAKTKTPVDWLLLTSQVTLEWRQIPVKQRYRLLPVSILDGRLLRQEYSAKFAAYISL